MTTPPRPTDIARDVLRIEADALSQMRDELPEDFDAVVARLLTVPGRVIVSGMGKSGHVAAKIAATMASTGTPAQYVHPGEASHGDLGMITAQDAVILISNSGETRELADIIAHTRRFAIPLIGITKKGQGHPRQTGRFPAATSRRARGLRHRHGAHHLDDLYHDPWRCARRGDDAPARV